jgi:hypothetical protein
MQNTLLLYGHMTVTYAMQVSMNFLLHNAESHDFSARSALYTEFMSENNLLVQQMFW